MSKSVTLAILASAALFVPASADDKPKSAEESAADEAILKHLIYKRADGSGFEDKSKIEERINGLRWLILNPETSSDRRRLAAIELDRFSSVATIIVNDPSNQAGPSQFGWVGDGVRETLADPVVRSALHGISLPLTTLQTGLGEIELQQQMLLSVLEKITESMRQPSDRLSRLDAFIQVQQIADAIQNLEEQASSLRIERERIQRALVQGRALDEDLSSRLAGQEERVRENLAKAIGSYAKLVSGPGADSFIEINTKIAQGDSSWLQDALSLLKRPGDFTLNYLNPIATIQGMAAPLRDFIEANQDLESELDLYVQEEKQLLAEAYESVKEIKFVPAPGQPPEGKTQVGKIEVVRESLVDAFNLVTEGPVVADLKELGPPGARGSISVVIDSDRQSFERLREAIDRRLEDQRRAWERKLKIAQQRGDPALAEEALGETKRASNEMQPYLRAAQRLWLDRGRKLAYKELTAYESALGSTFEELIRLTQYGQENVEDYERTVSEISARARASEAGAPRAAEDRARADVHAALQAFADSAKQLELDGLRAMREGRYIDTDEAYSRGQEWADRLDRVAREAERRQQKDIAAYAKKLRGSMPDFQRYRKASQQAIQSPATYDRFLDAAQRKGALAEPGACRLPAPGRRSDSAQDRDRRVLQSVGMAAGEPQRLPASPAAQNGLDSRAVQDIRRQAEAEQRRMSPPNVVVENPKLGGVDFNRPETLSFSPKLRGIQIDDDSRQVSFVGGDGTETALVLDPISKEILDAILYLRAKYGDLPQLAFTLNINQSEMDRCNAELTKYVDGLPQEALVHPGPLQAIHTIHVTNLPLFLGCDYGNTIIGQIALQADVALKYLANGLDPVTKKPFEGSAKYQEAVEKYVEPHAVRLWLYLKRGEFREDARSGRMLVDVEVGVQTKSIQHVGDATIIDVGEAPASVQAVAAILERDYDSIAQRVPSWKMLKEAYRMQILVQLMDTLKVPLPPPPSAAEVLRYTAPSTIDGLAAWRPLGVGPDSHLRCSYVIGGVDYAPWDSYDATGASRRAYRRRLIDVASRHSMDPFARVYCKFLDWKLNGVIEDCAKGLNGSESDLRFLLLRANAYACLALRIRAPGGAFDPLVLSDMVDDSVLQRLNQSGGEDCELEKLDLAYQDLSAAARVNPVVVWENVDRLNRMRELPGEWWFRRALATQAPADKLRLHSKSAEAYLATGNHAKASERLRYLLDCAPNDLEVHKRYTKACLEAQKARWVDEGAALRVVILPLKNGMSRKEDDWLCDGIADALSFVASRHGGLEVVPPSQVRQAMQRLGAGCTPEDLGRDPAVNAAWYVTGSFMKLQNAVQVVLNAGRVGGDEAGQASPKEDRDKPIEVLSALYRDLMMAIRGQFPSNPMPDDFPRTWADVQVWCEARQLAARGDSGVLAEYLASRSDAGNTEARLLLAELAIQEQDPQRALDLLRDWQAPKEVRWRQSLLLGQASWFAGDEPGAKQHLGEAWKLNSSSTATVALLRVLSRTEEERLELNRRLVDARYPDLGPYLDVALSLSTAGDKKGALVAIDRALAAVPFLSWANLERVAAALQNVTR